jgi:hypothetical protein
MYRIIVLLAISVSFISCLEFGSCHNYYSFEFPATVTAQDTFQLGDTIWCEMNLPNELLDRNSGTYIDFTDFELFYFVSISKVDTNFVYDAMHQFDIYSKKGRIEQQINNFTYTYVYFDTLNNKTFKFGLIPEEKGVYDMGISLASYFAKLETDDNREWLQITDSKCREHMYFESNVFINNGNDNYYIVDGICQWTFDSIQTCYESYEKHSKGGFAFVVK